MSGPRAGDPAVDLAARWLLESGIQSPGGGFHAWFDLDAGRPSFLYTEITGYGITTLLLLARVSGDRGPVARAVRAAEWILSAAAHPCGGVLTRLYAGGEDADPLYSFEGGRVFSFDTAMVLYGMVLLARETGERRFLDAARSMALFLTDRMQAADGSLLPVFDGRRGAPFIPGGSKWSDQAGPFHAKAALGLVEIFRDTGENRYRDSAVRLCDFALAAQEESGRFITGGRSATTNLHPHCYAAEGLLYAGGALGIPRFVDAARRGAEWALRAADGGRGGETFDPSAGRFSGAVRTDVLAQATRLAALLCPGGGPDGLRDALRARQYLGDAPGGRGGFLYRGDGRHVNSWCTMFAIHALALASEPDAAREAAIFV
ncbi:MAG: hypothetical protein PHN82_03625 [bacterium]|nr:hypothetical protein [bacterium]